MTSDSERWSINESLLQSYRGIFISSQSFLLAVGAIMWSESIVMLLIISSIGAIAIFGIWLPVVRSRHLIVDYYKYASRLAEEQKAKLCSERDYIRKKDCRRVANKLLGVSKNWRPTRWKIDLGLPILFAVIWVMLVLTRIFGW